MDCVVRVFLPCVGLSGRTAIFPRCVRVDEIKEAVCFQLSCHCAVAGQPSDRPAIGNTLAGPARSGGGDGGGVGAAELNADN